MQRHAARSALLVPTAIAATFVALCVPLAIALNVWQDEAYTLATTGAGIAHALHQSIYFEAQAPLYFVALAAWRYAGESAFLARVPSILAAVVTLYVVWSFAVRYIKGVWAGWVVLAFGISPFLIWAALEIRLYSTAVMLSAIVVYAFFRGFLDERPSAAARVGFVVAAVAGVYTQYYLGALVPACAAALLVLRRKEQFRAFAVAGCAFALALVPIAAVLPEQMRAYRALAEAAPLPGYAVGIAVLEFLFPHGWIGSWAHRPQTNALYAALVAVPVAIAVIRVRKLSPAAVALWTIAATVCAIFFLIVAVLHQHVIIPRHTAGLFAPLLLAAFASFDAVAPPSRKVCLSTFGAVYAAFSAATLWHAYSGLAKNGDWQRVADYLARNVAPGEPVALFDSEVEVPLRYYYHAAGPLVPVPRPMSRDHFDEAEFPLHSTADVAGSLGRAAAGQQRVWLVQNDACTTKASFYGCAYLQAYVASHFHVVSTARFDGSTVEELQPVDSPSAAATPPSRVRTFLYYGGEHINEDLPARFVAGHADYTEQAIGQGALAQAFHAAGGAHAVVYTDVAYNVYCGPPYGPQPAPAKCKGPWGTISPKPATSTTARARASIARSRRPTSHRRRSIPPPRPRATPTLSIRAAS